MTGRQGTHSWAARGTVAVHVALVLVALWLTVGQSPAQVLVGAGAAALLAVVANRHEQGRAVVAATTCAVPPPPEAPRSPVTPYWREPDLPHRPACPRAPGLD